MASNAAVASSLSELLEELGGISVLRVRNDPAPGHATIADLLQVNQSGSHCELIDGILVEKARG